jgi:phytanoyl-CoA hydroxylase
MRDQVTAAEIAAYRRDGFVILHDFLSPAELETWRSVVMAALDKRGRIRMPWDKQEVTTENTVFTQRVNLWLDYEPLRDLVVDQRLGRIATELAQVDGIRLWHDHALIKEPYGFPTAWHMDNPYWSFTHREACSMWLALDDATIQNGCMYFLPGVQHHGTPDKNGGAGGKDIGGLFKLYPEWQGIEPVAAEMKAGSCVFHSGYTPHSAGSNMTPRRRRAFVCTYMPVGSTYNGQTNIIPPEKVATLKVGDTLAFDDLNPVLYQRPAVAAST